MALTNAEVQSMIAEYGERICYIQFNNNYRIHIGYRGGHIKSVHDIAFKTVGSTDMIGFPHIGPGKKHMDATEPVYYSWRLTELIEDIIVMEEKYIDDRIDPFVLP